MKDRSFKPVRFLGLGSMFRLPLLTLLACAGSRGPEGPVGPQGVTGPQGATGPPGPGLTEELAQSLESAVALADAVPYPFLEEVRRGCPACHVLVDAETKAVVGCAAGHGEELYASGCADCHGVDGSALNFGSEDAPEYVGTLAADNPWEFTHKVRVGQPGVAMPAAVDSGWSSQDLVDLLSYAQTLPTEAP